MIGFCKANLCIADMVNLAKCAYKPKIFLTHHYLSSLLINYYVSPNIQLGPKPNPSIENKPSMH